MMNLKSIYKRLETSSFFRGVKLTMKNEIIIPTGCRYNDKSEILLYLIQRNGIFVLTDNGRTRAYMNKYFELKEDDVIKYILAITGYYGINTENKQLSIDIGSENDYIDKILKMIYCIGFLNRMSIFFI